MRSPTWLGPLVAAERRVIAAPRRQLEISPQDLIDSIEISDDEILDDLLHPAAGRSHRRPVGPGRSGGEQVQ